MKRATGKLLALFGVLILSVSCRDNRAVLEGNIQDVINREISLDMFENVHIEGKTYSWNDFRQNYSNISIVYLQEGCAPCYPKFIEWHKRMEQISTPDNYTVLFIINARHYENFIRYAKTYGEADQRYFHVMDPDNQFIIRNPSIPRKLIDRSLLVDKYNRIKMVGEPFANADMTKVFHIVTGFDAQPPDRSK